MAGVDIIEQVRNSFSELLPLLPRHAHREGEGAAKFQARQKKQMRISFGCPIKQTR